MAYVLGVDLGTTYTAAATGDGAADVLGLGNRGMQAPSLAYLQPDGSMVFGESAERRGAADPARLAREFTRRIGDPTPIVLAGTPFSADMLTAGLLRWVVDQSTERLAEPPAAIIVTHPAGWSRFTLDLLGRAAGVAGVPHVSFCPEPVAAAIHYATRNRVAEGARICVYDLGGGSFDVCVLAREGDMFRIDGPPGGVQRLGGSAFDEAVFRRVLAEIEHDPAAQALLADPVSLARLRRDCIEAKEALSADFDTVVPVAVGGTGRSVRVTRGEFEDMIRPMLAETVSATHRTLQAAGATPSDIDAFVLVGGSCRIPLVGELLAAEFHRPIVQETHPKHAVALGASTPAARGPVTTPPFPPPSGLPPWSGPPSGPPSSPPPIGHVQTPAGAAALKRNRILIGVGAAVAVIAIAATVFALTRDPSAVGPSTTTPSTISSPMPTGSTAPSSSSTTTISSGPPLLPLPRSVQPLADSIVITPRVVEGDLDLALVDSVTGQTVGLLAAPGGSAAAPDVSPDRRSIIYVASGERLRVMAADGSGDEELVPGLPDCAGRMLRPGWNQADPNELALVCVDAQNTHLLRIVRVDGTVVRTLDVGQPLVDDMSYSPDGSRVVFWAGPRGGALDGGAIYTMATDGSAPPVRITDGMYDADPVWSPDGAEIVFRRYVDDGVTPANMEIALVRPDGSDLRVLAPHVGNDIDPAWSPDGRQIVWKSNRGDGADVGFNHHLVMNADGSEIRRLAPDNPFPEEQAPAWGNR